MSYRLGKYEFLKTSQFKAFQEEGFSWRVCKDYEVEVPSGNVGAYVQAKYPRNQKDKWIEYKPLNDAPDLFLKFARLHEGEISTEVAREWARKYGLLGYVPSDEVGFEKEDAVDLSWEQIRRARSSHDERVKDGALSIFREETARAAGVLAMYEATLDGDNNAAKS